MFLNELENNLPDKPRFKSFYHLDVNPLGGTEKRRHLMCPNDSMKIVHKRLVGYLRSLIFEFKFVSGSRPGNSTKNNILRHKHSRFFYLLDIKNAYPSVSVEKLAEVLLDVKPVIQSSKEELVKFLTKYCIAPEGGLIIGSPSSPDLFNLYCAVLVDNELEEFCFRNKIIYSRYLDDLTFSSENPIGKRKRKIIREAIQKCGLKISHQKSQVIDLQKGPIFINGIGLEWGGRIFLPRHYLRKIKGLIFSAKKGEVDSYKVYGMLGVFYSSTKKGRMNETEKDLVSCYVEFKKLLTCNGAP